MKNILSNVKVGSFGLVEKYQKFREEFISHPFFWLGLLAVVFVPLFTMPLSGEAEKTSLFFLLAGLSAWKLSRVKEWKLPMRLVLPLAAFLLAVILSAVFAPDFWQAILGRSSRFHGSVSFYLSWALVMLALMTGLKQSLEKIVLHALVFCGLAIALLGIVQSFGVAYFGGIQSLISPSLERVPSFVGNPNFSSFVIAVLWPAAFALTFVSSRRLSFWYGWVATGIMLVSLGVFASRGALLGASASVVILIFWLWKNSGWKKMLLAVLPIVIFLGVAFTTADLYHPAFSETGTSGDRNTTSRFYIWNESLVMVGKYPWLGVGPGGFLSEYMKNGSDPAHQEGWFDDPHNLFLHIAATVGLPGLLAFVALLSLAGLFALRRMWQEPGNLFNLVGLCGLSAFVVASMFNPVTMSLWAVLAILIPLCLFEGGGQKDIYVLNNWLRRSFGLFAFGFFVFGLLWFVGDYSTAWAAQFYRTDHKHTAEIFAKSATRVFPAVSGGHLIIAALNVDKNPVLVEKELTYVGEKYSDDPSVQIAVAKIYWLLWEKDKNEKFSKLAFAATDKAYMAATSSANPLIVQGYFYFLKGETKNALAVLNEAVTLEDGQVQAWQLLATAYQKDGNRKAMIKSLERLVFLRPTTKTYKDILAAAKSSPDINFVHLQAGKLEVYF
jgi:O-antigen ligase